MHTTKSVQDWVRARRLEKQAVLAIELVHATIFLALLACVLKVSYSGVRDRVTRGTILSLVAVTVEAVFCLNRRRCPITVFVEELGASHGSVSHVLLPNWLARYIFSISSALLGLGMACYAVRRLASGRRRSVVAWPWADALQGGSVPGDSPGHASSLGQAAAGIAPRLEGKG